MLRGEIRNQVDAIWNAFLTGGMSNPSQVIEQITYLLFVRRPDELHALDERKAERRLSCTVLAGQERYVRTFVMPGFLAGQVDAEMVDASEVRLELASKAFTGAPL